MSPEGTAALLDGWTVATSPGQPPPVAAAAAFLQRFGAAAVVAEREALGSLRIRDAEGRRKVVTLPDWRGEQALRSALDEVGEPSLAPGGNVLTAYAALRLAGAAADRNPAVVTTRGLIDELLAARPVRGRIRPELVRCHDGWVVARFRDDDERELFRVLTAEGGLPTEEAVAVSRSARLLVAAVRPPVTTQRPGLGTGALDGGPNDRVRPRVVDWTVLWAGPWAAQRLRDSGAVVRRVEHPRRRDGLLNSPPGRRWWSELNDGKELALLDAGDPHGRSLLAAAIEDADILFTSMTPRALHSLGFDDPWRERVPGLLHVELVAFDDPWADAPGLGEHGAAEAGLLWRPDGEPAKPYAWADPLLGALALAFCRFWLASKRRRGGRIRMTLERAASLAFSVEASADASAGRLQASAR